MKPRETSPPEGLVGVAHPRLVGLLNSWKGRAKRKFTDAKGEEDEMGRKLIEHGAMCYFNAATELEEVLKQIQADAVPRP